MANTSTNIFPFVPILTLILITLKLTNYINWNWLWVLSPMWIPLGIVAIVFTVIFIFLLIKSMMGLR